MSKSFYKEALLAIVTEALKQPGKPVIIEHTGLNELKKTIEQAQKQEELLGHYKDLAEVRKELYDLTINFKQSNKDRMIVLFTQETLVSDIIKELENDKRTSRKVLWK